MRVLVVDEHRVAAEALADYLRTADDVDGAEVATDAGSALRRAREGYDVIVVDHSADNGASGSEVVEALSHLGTEAKVLILTDRDDPEEIAAALEVGAHGASSKYSSPAFVLDAVRRVASDDTVLPAHLVGPVLSAMAGRGRRARDRAELLAALTPREEQILALLAQGLSRKRIATRLELSPNTVRTHLQRVLAKLSVHSQLEAAAIGRELFGS